MRNFLFLAVIGFSFIFTGCGVVRNVASTLNHEICEKSYNKFVCPDRSPTVSEKPAHTPLCYGVSVRTTAAVNNLAHTDQGPYCKKLQNEATRKAFESKPGTTCAIEGKGKFQKVVCAGFGHIGGILLILLTLLWGRGLCDFMVANVENEGTYHNRYLDKDYVCSFSKMWAACKVMIIALIAIIILLASATNLYAACTEKQIAANKVTTQYGFLRYDCHKDEVPQAKKDAIFEVVWRGFVAKGGLKMDMSKPYVYTRWQRLESVFFKVWGDAPLWQAKVAVAICTKEYVCGVSTKFSEWEGKRWESRKNHNGSVDCGITQINSDSTDKSCDELQDYETAFREQRRILMEKIISEKKSVWKERVFRYIGSGKSAREYGRIIMSWAM